MQHLHDMFAQNLSWLIGGPSDKNQSPDETHSSKDGCIPTSVYFTPPNSARLNNDEKVDLTRQVDCDFESDLKRRAHLDEEPNENISREESLLKETLQNETDNKEESRKSDTETQNEDGESKDKCIKTLMDTIVDIETNDSKTRNTSVDEPINVHPSSYASYFAKCNEYIEQNKINPVSSEDGESLHGYESVLETPPPIQPDNHTEHTEGFELAEYPLPVENADIEASVNQCINAPINAPNDALSASHAANYAECKEFAQRNRGKSSVAQGEESLQNHELVVETSPLVQPKCSEEGFEVPAYPTLKDPEPTIDLSLACQAGEIPRFCSHCLRWEDQGDDQREEKKMASNKCCMFGNIVFFRKLKRARAQCPACGFEMPKKVEKGRKISKVKKFLRKVTGKEYNRYEFNGLGMSG